MRTLAQLRNYSLLVFFLLLVGGVVLQPGNSNDAASVPSAATEDGGVYRAG